MNPYNQKASRGQKLVNGIVITLCLAACAGVAAVAVANKNAIAAAYNGMLGDNEKVTFSQVLKETDLVGVNGNTVSGGVLTCNTSEAALPVTRHDANRFYYCSCELVSTKAVGSYFGYNHGTPVLIFGKATSEVNVWLRGSFCKDYRASDGSASYLSQFDSIGSGVFTASGDIAKLRHVMKVDVLSLGVSDVAEACAVWEKLAGTDYFEGDKTFTKGQIKKAIADYEAEQAALKSSAAASTATSSAAA